MTADLCEHCGEPESGVHWSRCYVCHPERRQGSMVGRCDLHRRIGAQCEGVAAYAGIVALGEWAAQCARSVRVKCPTCRCMRRVWPPPGPCMCCAGFDDTEPLI